MTVGDERLAAQFLTDAAQAQRRTMHEVFDAIDFDGDGYINAHDMYVFACAHAATGRSKKSQPLEADFDLLLASVVGEGSQGCHVSLSQFQECVEIGQVREGAGFREQAIDLLYEHFAKLAHQKRVSSSSSAKYLQARGTDVGGVGAGGDGLGAMCAHKEPRSMCKICAKAAALKVEKRAAEKVLKDNNYSPTQVRVLAGESGGSGAGGLWAV